MSYRLVEELPSGVRFSFLVVKERTIKLNPTDGSQCTAYKCICDCGNEAIVFAARLTHGRQKSCGCSLRHKHLSARNKANARHGMSRTAIHMTWSGMMSRCYDSNAANYDRYGGRGIKVCERWHKFENFYADMGDKPKGLSIDRYPNNDGDYEPPNCRWATDSEQNRNRSNNRMLEMDGRAQLLVDWSMETGLSVQVIRARLQRGWSIKDALTLKAGEKK